MVCLRKFLKENFNIFISGNKEKEKRFIMGKLKLGLVGKINALIVVIQIIILTATLCVCIESIKNIISHSSDSYEIFDDGLDCKQLFEGLMNLKVTDAQQLGRSKKSHQDDKMIIGDMLINEYTPLVYNAITKNKTTFSANIECGVAINANSDKKEKALNFLKYLLSESTQEYWCGDKKGSAYAGSNMITLPVNNKAFERHLEKALEITDDYGSVIGTDNDYNEFAKAYINIIENINEVSLYFNNANSYYSKNVIGDIVDKYIDGDISIEKFIRQLTSATEIYLTE